jgi:hypothetical protein
MFEYTTTTIINSQYAVDAAGNPLLDNSGNLVARVKNNNGNSFTVIGAGTYLKDNIKSIYKRPYAAGVKEQATLTVAGVTSKDLLRLTVKVKLDGNTESDYANFTYDFRQPLTIDIISSGTAATDAAEFVKALNKIKTEYGRSLFVASVSGATITFKAKTNDQRFESIVLEKVGSVPLNTLSPEITQLAVGTVTVPGKNGFGDDAWMLKSVVFPTAENTRVFGILKDERPVLGANYTQYTLKYVVPSDEYDVWNGNKQSVTNHVFWVAASQVSAFETAVTAVFADLETVGDNPAQNFESEPGGAVGSNDLVTPAP